jgi:hypothetical protein
MTKYKTSDVNRETMMTRGDPNESAGSSAITVKQPLRFRSFSVFLSVFFP